MQTINRLIDAARKACDRESDMALAEKMKVARNSVSVWRKGGKITDEHLAALVELAKADPSEAIKVRAEQASSKAEIRLGIICLRDYQRPHCSGQCILC